MNREQSAIYETTSGKIQGFIHDNIVEFRGIPYAAPPVGALRFAPPQKPEPWPGVRICNDFQDAATQENSILINASAGEDCLYLNIWAPPKESGIKRPVLFWIHGGGFFNGCGTMPYYNGTSYARQGIVVVTINYRLGALGFLPLSTLLNKIGRAHV